MSYTEKLCKWQQENPIIEASKEKEAYTKERLCLLRKQYNLVALKNSMDILEQQLKEDLGLTS